MFSLSLLKKTQRFNMARNGSNDLELLRLKEPCHFVIFIYFKSSLVGI